MLTFTKVIQFYIHTVVHSIFYTHSDFVPEIDFTMHQAKIMTTSTIIESQV